MSTQPETEQVTKAQIAMSTDMKRLGPSLVTLCSSLRHTSLDLDVHFFGERLSDDARCLVETAVRTSARTTLNYIDISDMPFDPPSWAGAPKAMMARLLLPTVATGRVLYLDVDTMAVSSIDSLFELDLKGNPIAATRDFTFLNMYVRNMNLHRDRFDFNSRIMAPHPVYDYFNSGVMILDIDAICANSDWKSGMTDVQAAWDMNDGDQSWLNHVFRGNVTFLDPSYNCIWGRSRKIFRIAKSQLPENLVHELSKPKINHFCGLTKPWRYLGAAYYLNPEKFFKYGYTALTYRRRAEAFFKDLERMCVAEADHQNESACIRSSAMAGLQEMRRTWRLS